ncbi:hypothetical protein M2139_001527 [Enterococcus sp. PF1-24]|uniref:hypothetical protein n=1 Tax=unclassified Enterococcus TaxID=2608891 RepID=UPI00247535CC|nr:MULTISPECIES: hypothetical protein [unclassified Enterococcus]MDH6364482.1 hypothetical protein [Enterococcus sp. PFB1-1]MDH6401641.1 hypothetical protein [Enterococcus sp. PF1-24]
MAEIRNLNIFNANKGLAKIKEKQNSENLKKEATPTPLIKPKEKRIVANDELARQKEEKKTKNVGPPLKTSDRVLVTTNGKPIKISPLLHSVSTILTEKYQTELTRDEILREAIDQYIRSKLNKEDKQSLFLDLERELELYREKHPTLAEYDKEGNLVRRPDEIEEYTAEQIKKRWEI